MPSSSAAATTASSARRCWPRAAARCWCSKPRPNSAALLAREEFAPGFRVSLAHVLNRLHPEVIAALELASHGLNFAGDGGVPSVALSAGRRAADAARRLWREARRRDRRAKRAWKELRAQLIRYAGIMKPLLSRRPPDLDGMSLSESAGFGLVALALRRLGKEDMRDFLRVLLMNVADVLDEQLAGRPAEGLLAFDATLGSHLGPRSPTSLLGLYYRLAGEIGGAAGAQTCRPAAWARSSRRSPLPPKRPASTIRTGAPVGKIVVENGRAVGVVLDIGRGNPRAHRSCRPSIRARPSSIWSARASSTPALSARSAISA